MSGCPRMSVVAGAMALLLSAGGLFAANSVYATAADGAPALGPFLQHLSDDDNAPAAAHDWSIVLEETYRSIGTGDEPLGTTAFLDDIDTPEYTAAHNALHGDADDAPRLTRADFPPAPGRFETAFLLSRPTQQALDGIEQTPVNGGVPRPAIQNEVIPSTSALSSGIFMVAGLLIYRLHRKILQLS